MSQSLKKGKCPRVLRRMITVRLPATLHVELIERSHELRVSLNQLCVSLLMRHGEDPDGARRRSKR